MKSLWQRIKSWPFIKPAIALVMAMLIGWSVGRQAANNRRADTLEGIARENAGTGARRSLEAAKKANEKAAAHRATAEAHKQRAEARLDELGKSDADLADLIERWNTERLRDE